MTSYTPNIPQAADQLNQSQPLILNNFLSIESGFNENHVAITDIADRGKHKYMVMPVQGSEPTTASGEGELHTEDVSGDSQLFFSRDNDSGTKIQITDGLLPNILSGTWTSTASFDTIANPPDNTYGLIFLMRLVGGSNRFQSGTFYKYGGDTRAYSNRLFYLEDTAFDHNVTLNDEPTSSRIQGKYSVPASGATFQYKIVYWFI